MKQYLPLLAMLLFTCAASAQHPSSTPEKKQVFQPSETETEHPEYLYCQIIGDNRPVPADEKVIFDFGQRPSRWSFNLLRDTEGNNYQFHSVIQALNFMSAHGWEFVQALSSGEKGEQIHLLLRIPFTSLPDEVALEAVAEPEIQ